MKGKFRTLPRKFDAVQRKTTTRSRSRPSVCRAMPTIAELGLFSTLSLLVDPVEDLETCISSASPSNRLEDECCPTRGRVGRSLAFMVGTGLT